MSQLETQKLEEHEMMGLLDAVKGSLVGDHRTKMALGSVSSIAHVMERNGTAQATMQKRTPEWFKENGKKELIVMRRRLLAERSQFLNGQGNVLITFMLKSRRFHRLATEALRGDFSRKAPALFLRR